MANSLKYSVPQDHRYMFIPNAPPHSNSSVTIVKVMSTNPVTSSLRELCTLALSYTSLIPNPNISVQSFVLDQN